MIRAKDRLGNVYLWESGGWRLVSDATPYAQAMLNSLNSLRRLGRAAFPGLAWSQALPPQREYEDNLILAEYEGLEILEVQPVYKQYGHY